MTRPTGYLSVNPDGVISVGDAYAEHAELYNQYLAQITSMRERYASAWGDDDMGKEFSTKFLEGLGNLEDLVGAVKGTLAYTSEGLRTSGKEYREADEAAQEAGEKMARDFDSSLNGPPLARRSLPAGEVQTGEVQPLMLARKAVLAETVPAEKTQLRQARTAVRGKVAEEPVFEGDENEAVLTPARNMRAGVAFEGVPPLEEGEQQPLLARQRVAGVLREGEPLEVTQAAVRTRGALLPAGEPVPGEAPLMRGVLARGEVTVGETTTPGEAPLMRGVLARGEVIEPGETTTPEEPLRSRVLAPTESFSAVQPAMPAISSFMMMPEYATAYVGGEPLPEGYRLQALNTFEDGSARVDANLYDSVTPLAGTPVTTPEGKTIDPEGRQFFVVKDNPAADPTAPGYQPLVLSYSADGTPSPLF
ncbi:WXG100 family type VII secretion target [Actinoplanes sp. RD1]|uniref:hypothetical protein n=1 Tax=Actinoplanes sp. RD1 TaxID=3064538 RepID=UPI002740954D|nr:hypothetical protein [Actinoplanes sp. RD1]